MSLTSPVSRGRTAAKTRGGRARAASTVPTLDDLYADTVRASAGECWRLADIYGDQASLFCEFSLAGSTHALMALVDFNGPGPWVRDVWLSGEPRTVLAEMGEQARAEADMMTLDRIDPVEVRRLLETGLIEADPTDAEEIDPEDPDDSADMSNTLAEYRAVALARCRTLPDAAPAAEPPEVTAAEQEALVSDFLATEPTPALADPATTATCARIIAEFEADFDPDRLLRVSPAKAEIFLLEWLPSGPALDEPVREAMPAVFLDWTRWAATRHDLPESALATLFEVTEEAAAHLDEAYEASPAAAMRPTWWASTREIGTP
jgi:hypothetical protein